MPNPTAPPPPALMNRELPEDFDDLMRQAMRGGSAVSRLKEALGMGGGRSSKARRPARPRRPPPRPAAANPSKPDVGELVVPTRRPPPSAGAFEDEDTSPFALGASSMIIEDEEDEDDVDTAPPAHAGPDGLVEIPPDALSPEPIDPPLPPLELPGHAAGPELEAELLRLWDRAAGALNAWREGEPEVARRALDEVEAALVAAREAMPPAEEHPLALPFHQKPLALVIDGLADPARAGELSSALSMDAASARLLASNRWARVALRSEDRASLEALVERARDRGIAATVLGPSDLRSTPVALAVLGRAEDGTWRVSPRPLWALEGPPDRSAQRALELDDFALAVPGDVVIRHFRERVSGRWGRKKSGLQAAGERRVRVLDLHAERFCLRVVVGACDFSGLPGFQPGSAARSMQGLIDALAAVWPGIRVEGRRVCAPTGDRYLEAEDGRAEESGWALWEEHSRSCRLHALNHARSSA